MAAGRIEGLLPHLRDLVSRGDNQTADRELLQRFSAGQDEAAFAEIVRRHGPVLLRVCRRVLHNGHDAEDVCQAAFLLLAQKATSVRWRDSVAGWLFQTAYRLSLKARTAGLRRSRHEAQARPAAPADPLAELTVREMQAVLDEELHRLPEPYRAPILLCCLEGRSRDEAAADLGWPLATVKDRLERGRERLRARLARRGVQLGTALASAWLLEGTAQAGLSPHATARAASLIATGQATLASFLPARVAALAKGVTTTMLVCRMTMLALAGSLLALGVAAGVTKPSGKPAAIKAQAAQAKPAAADAAPAEPEALPLVGHKGKVNAITFAHGGKSVATAGADGTVRVWDPTTGVQLHKLEQAGKAAGVAFSPDGRVLAGAFVGPAGKVGLWDTATGKPLWQSGHKMPGPRAAVAFSPDGRQVLAGFGDESGSFHAATGKMLFLFRGQPGGATAVAISPDGKHLVVGGGGSVMLLDRTTGRALRTWRSKGNVTSVAFLPTGTRIAATDGGQAIRMLDLTTGKEESAFAAKDAIRALALSPDGKRAATALSDGTILLWDSSGRQERRFSARGAVHAMAFSPDGKRLATAGEDGAILWDLTRDEKPLPKDFKLTDKEVTALWDDLASSEGGKVYTAARLLRADPARSVPFLLKRLARQEETPDKKKLKKLIADLDSDEFKTRDAAMKALEKLGSAAEEAMREALAARPSLEAKTRLERLLRLLGTEGALTAEQQRDVRAVRVLEQAGTPAARKALQALVKESRGWWASKEAKEALERMSRRDKKP
jgi:RNA polymerase sigma factor (sigma-70 family)